MNHGSSPVKLSKWSKMSHYAASAVGTVTFFMRCDRSLSATQTCGSCELEVRDYTGSHGPLVVERAEVVFLAEEFRT